MLIPIEIESRDTGRIIKGEVTPRQLLDYCDESDLIDVFTACACEAVGETLYPECQCEDEWMDCVVRIGPEITSP